MLPFLSMAWSHVYALMSDPAFEGFLLLVIVGAEAHAVLVDRKHLAVARQTLELYRTYFEVTEKRKAEAREKAAATRAAKKAAEAPVETPPVPAEGVVPPPMSLPDNEDIEEAM